jgi:hypothetical protein
MKRAEAGLDRIDRVGEEVLHPDSRLDPLVGSSCSARRTNGIRCSTGGDSASLAALANLRVVHDEYEKRADLATRERGALAGFEVGEADPGFTAGPQNTDIIPLYSVSVGLNLSAIHAFGSPAYSGSELLEAPEDTRVAADQILAEAEQLRLTPVDDPLPAGGSATGGCRWDRHDRRSIRKLPHRPRRRTMPPHQLTCLAPESRSACPLAP